MNRFSGSMITQQMYTRERRGVYRSTEGFDTVAKSESLDNNFVKKFCIPSASTMPRLSLRHAARRMRSCIRLRSICSIRRATRQ